VAYQNLGVGGEAIQHAFEVAGGHASEIAALNKIDIRGPVFHFSLVRD